MGLNFGLIQGLACTMLVDIGGQVQKGPVSRCGVEAGGCRNRSSPLIVDSLIILRFRSLLPRDAEDEYPGTRWKADGLAAGDRSGMSVRAAFEQRLRCRARCHLLSIRILHPIPIES